ncbi:hypothetical protein PF005_g1979 [Phytophthora fragariae]|uniref:Uncharacterized protein n=1 Tax=Phytophthora fragariae TaxID=53985 RepID=A0A6A3TJ53_9STRA|nr:hypothetical protein PF003_g22356 [Phytophthora fragariae]KAE8948541.1 hypothetical protein PF009_g1875 [Phytophthora fragariae]KAE9028558.1 hypothetical protein PF011_g1508 [Phytophthora fragariae]KAE9136391.1 hypothetical protein PF010_g1709 [Phytophthora fragariae]KAE9138161.1 hypothetical protein PF007_g1523 [Phytophthora fragariae]
MWSCCFFHLEICFCLRRVSASLQLGYNWAISSFTEWPATRNLRRRRLCVLSTAIRV